MNYVDLLILLPAAGLDRASLPVEPRGAPAPGRLARSQEEEGEYDLETLTLFFPHLQSDKSLYFPWSREARNQIEFNTEGNITSGEEVFFSTMLQVLVPSPRLHC